MNRGGPDTHCTVPHVCRVSSSCYLTGGDRSSYAVQLCRAQNVGARLIGPAKLHVLEYSGFSTLAFPVFSELPAIPFGCCALVSNHANRPG